MIDCNRCGVIDEVTICGLFLRERVFFNYIGAEELFYGLEFKQIHTFRGSRS